MLYAQVVFGLAVSGPFDYIVPQAFAGKIKPGARVRLSFGRRMLVGYVVGLTHTTGIKNLKPIAELIDDVPLLDKNALLLTKWLADYYCCSWGEAIETALPTDLRKGKAIPAAEYSEHVYADQASTLVLQCVDRPARWEFYSKEISRTIEAGRQAIMLLPDMQALLTAKDKIASGLNTRVALLYRKQPKELEAWFDIRKQDIPVVLGTRSAIFAPLDKLGLIIIDEEEDFVYKQDQVPHYHARDVALKRAEIEKAGIILGGAVPSLESFYLSKKDKAAYVSIPKSGSSPQVDIIPPARKYGIKTASVLSGYATDSISGCLGAHKKILVFLNRKGFATFAFCHNCGLPLKCPRCAINLVYHYKEQVLSCHYCNFKMTPPEICPSCNSGYIKYSGLGTEKIVSELARMFPQAKIAKWDEDDTAAFKDADIFVGSQSIIRGLGLKFGLIVVMAADNSLNRIDFRSAEKTFAILSGLSGLTDEKIIIETYLNNHHCFKALKSSDTRIFYDEELRHRKQLSFPPYRHLVAVKLRGKDSARVKEIAGALFEFLNKRNNDKGIKLVSLNPGYHQKLRGNFYWQILFSSVNPEKLNRFLKISLKDFPHSGIIVTVDVDPI